jgi:hypothetical protein
MENGLKNECMFLKIGSYVSANVDLKPKSALEAYPLPLDFRI